MQMPPSNQAPNMFNQALSKGAKATMWLFSPRQLQNHYIRPIVYNFTPTFNQYLHDTIAQNGRKGKISVGSHFSSYGGIANSPNAKTLITPATNCGFDVMTGRFSENWTFVLVVDNDVNPAVLGASENRPLTLSSIQSAIQKNRTLYYGICLNEPVIRSSVHNTTPTTNPDCGLVVTHKTTIGENPVYRSNGTKMSRMDNITDVDVIPSSIYSMLSTNQENYLMRPQDVINTTYEEDEGNSREDYIQNTNYLSDIDDQVQNIATLITPNDSINRTQNNTPYTASLNSPVAHSNMVLFNVIDSVERQMLDTSPAGNSNPFTSFDVAPRVNEQISNSLYDTPMENSIGLRVNEVILLSEIENRYNPNIQPIITKNVTQMDITPQGYTSANNVMSSMITSTLPSIMSRHGVASFSFMYNSPKGAYKTEEISLLAGTTNQAILNAKASIMYKNLITELFEPIKATVGHFDVSVFCSCGGDCNVNFNALDYSDRYNTGIYQNNGILGGITSQLIGNSDVLKSNGINLRQMTNSLASSLV